MINKKVFLLLNGEPPLSLPDLSGYDVICATDGAYHYLEKHQITPDFISGDFDSSEQFPEHLTVIHTPNQDYSDFDKVLKILHDKNYINIDVFGASGQEQDHFLGNLHTAVQWHSKLELKFFDNYGFYFLAKNQTVYKGCKGKHVSLVPFPKATGVVTRGLQYPLDNETLHFGERIGTRNRALEDEIEISFQTGNLFIFINSTTD
ncbi:thiamine diphosphokinase [Gaetbulibacter saemankumensis]|uniref:thiamine diphosphokinase n=1 Tax=Gaetbulibacter saemankumensis TaxID=311208 RepID=UPI000481C972|nr:thiamine diphosphokinase [Gaetbulibacter saemankumensis]